MSYDIEHNVTLGRAAVRAGDVDGNYTSPYEDKATGYVDALTNIMHAAKADGVSFDVAVDAARMCYEEERR